MRSTSSSGIGIFTVFGLIFIVLKVTGLGIIATWNWIWVLSPFWIPFAFVLLIFLLVAIFGAAANRRY